MNDVPADEAAIGEAAIDEAALEETALNDLVALADGEAGVLRSLVGVFLESTSELEETLERAVQSGDRVAAARSLHSLKASTAMFGAMNASELCRELEAELERADLGDPGPIGARISLLRAALRQVRKRLERRFVCL